VAPEREPDPQLVVELEDISVAEEQIRMTLFVVFTDATGMTLHDVELVFVSDDGSIRRTVTVGSLPANESAEYPTFETNVTFSEPPKKCGSESAVWKAQTRRFRSMDIRDQTPTQSCTIDLDRRNIEGVPHHVKERCG